MIIYWKLKMCDCEAKHEEKMGKVWKKERIKCHFEVNAYFVLSTKKKNKNRKKNFIKGKKSWAKVAQQKWNKFSIFFCISKAFKF